MDSDRTILSPLATSLYLVDSKGNKIQIDREMIAGRDAGCDMLLDEGRCSRRHASLAPSALGILVTDLGSSNGTFINGNRIEKGVAKAGDELGFDTARYKVEGTMPAQVQSDATILAPPLPVIPEKTPEPPPSAAPASVKPAIADAPVESQKGSWWAPQDAGPEGTLFIAQSASAPAAVEGTQVMAALSDTVPSLVGLNGNVKGQSFRFVGGRCKIGRDASECEVVLDDPGVSSLHAQIINEGETWKLINLMSSNGSFVNGQRVQTAYLSGGDRLQFGATELIFNLGGLKSASSGGGISATETVVVAAKGNKPAWIYLVVGFAFVAAAGAALLLMK
jgi:pSer/pThr/pTyr-binding forkhead associated (FHA) protein